jgi:hypothetical protein
MRNELKVELKRIDPDVEPCVSMRIDVPEDLTLDIRRALLGKLKYGQLSIKDAYVFLAKTGLGVFEENDNLVESYISSVAEGANGSNMSIPVEVSRQLDAIKPKLGLNKKKTFLVLLKAGLVRYQNQNSHALQPA